MWLALALDKTYCTARQLTPNLKNTNLNALTVGLDTNNIESAGEWENQKHKVDWYFKFILFNRTNTFGYYFLG